MGFWSTVAKLAGVAAIPFTGGASAALTAPAWLAPTLSTVGALGSALGSAGQGRAEGRVAEAGVNQNQDQLALQRFLAEQNAALGQGNLDLNQREFALRAPQERANQSVRGSILQNVQDVGVSHPRANVVNFSGGLRPSLLTPESRALGGVMTRKALLDQMQGDTFRSMPGTTPPALTGLPQSGKLDTALNLGGVIGGLAQGLTPPTAPEATVAGQYARGSPWDTATPPPVTLPPRPTTPFFSSRPYRNLFAPTGG